MICWVFRAVPNIEMIKWLCSTKQIQIHLISFLCCVRRKHDRQALKEPCFKSDGFFFRYTICCAKLHTPFTYDQNANTLCFFFFPPLQHLRLFALYTQGTPVMWRRSGTPRESTPSGRERPWSSPVWLRGIRGHMWVPRPPFTFNHNHQPHKKSHGTTCCSYLSHLSSCLSFRAAFFYFNSVLKSLSGSGLKV